MNTISLLTQLNDEDRHIIERAVKVLNKVENMIVDHTFVQSDGSMPLNYYTMKKVDHQFSGTLLTRAVINSKGLCIRAQNGDIEADNVRLPSLSCFGLL